MRRSRFAATGPLWLLCALSMALIGCHSQPSGTIPSATPYIAAATAIEYPDLDCKVQSNTHSTVRPVTLISETSPEYWEMPFEECLHIALQNSKVFRDAGGVILRSPGNAKSHLDPAIQESDPRFGPQAALSAFDATFATSLYYENNDRALNNVFFGGGTRELRQKSGVFQAQINKRTPFGSEFTLRHNADYDQNNAPGNQFTSAWNTNFEAEFRQSLLRGAGTDFGRIAGTSRVPGVYNGILIARTNTDIAIADFEISVRDFISDIENAYWDLYFAYRDLDTKIAARDSALETWRRVQALAERGRVGAKPTRKQRLANSITASRKKSRTHCRAVWLMEHVRTTAPAVARFGAPAVSMSPSDDCGT